MSQDTRIRARTRTSQGCPLCLSGEAVLVTLAVPISGMLFQRRLVRSALEILATCLADDGLGFCVLGAHCQSPIKRMGKDGVVAYRFQLRGWAFGSIFGVAFTLGLRFGSVAHLNGGECVLGDDEVQLPIL